MNINNLYDFKNKLPFIDLYTHDLGIDSSSDYMNQESINLQAHLGAALAGFLVLKKDGCFIAKQYTYFKDLSINLIIIYASMFNNFYLCKPLTSRPRNSEIYLIGIGFIGMSKKIENILSNKLKNFDLEPLFDINDISNDIIEPLKKFANKVFGEQIKYLKEFKNLYNKSYYNNLTTKLSFYKKLNEIKNIESNKWIKNNKIIKILSSDYISSIS